LLISKSTKNSISVGSYKFPQEQVMPTELREVFPMSQTFELNGEFVNKRVRPLTYALMTYVKGFLGQPDTIDIDDDEDGQWNFTLAVADEQLDAMISTDEENCLISLFVDFGRFSVDNSIIHQINQYFLSKNVGVPVGQLRVIHHESECYVRYFNCVDVSGIASQDPNYEGPHRIHPELIKNMHEYAEGIVNNVYPEFKEMFLG